MIFEEFECGKQIQLDSSVSAKMNPSELSEFKKELERVYIPPGDFEFLKKTNGLRPGMMHIVQSRTGVGKSTLVRSMILPAIESGKHVGLVYSSEESLEQFKMAMSFSGSMLNNLFFMDEEKYGNNARQVEFVLSEIQKQIKKRNPSFFIFDNLTTCRSYSEMSSELIDGLRSLMKKTEIAFVVIAHTAKSYKGGAFMTNEDIRGHGSSANRCEFIYGYYFVSATECGHTTRRAFVHFLKDRFYQNSGKVFEIYFDSEKKIYTGSDELNFNKFKDYWNMRNDR